MLQPRSQPGPLPRPLPTCTFASSSQRSRSSGHVRGSSRSSVKERLDLGTSSFRERSKARVLKCIAIKGSQSVNRPNPSQQAL